MTATRTREQDVVLSAGIGRAALATRVLVTGSRVWPRDRQQVVWDALDEQAVRRGLVNLVIVHGACPAGADRYAHEWARFWSVTEERHPAQWAAYGAAAGPMRNTAMIDAGADLCIAFPMPGSKGTWDTVTKARAAGIPVRIIEGPVIVS